MNFKDWWINENSMRTGAKLGLYPPLEDALGQYPPLYGTPAAADLVTYIYIAYGDKGVPGKNGIIQYGKEREMHSANWKLPPM
jgi:hypothetical protein